MKSFSPPNLLSRSLIGAVGLGVALLGLPQSAKAVNVFAGTDYVMTPSEGANIYFTDLGRFVSFEGLAIGTPTATPPDGGFSGKADTVINRLDDVEAPYYLPSLSSSSLINGTLPANNVTRLQIVGLSLQGTGGDANKVFVGLDPAKVSGGEMAIAHNQTDDTGGIWTSYFGIHGMAVVANDGVTLTPTGNDYVRDLISNCGTVSDYTCHPFSKGFQDFTRTITLDGGSVGQEDGTGNSFKSSDQPWSHTPTLADQILGDNLVEPTNEQNFFLTQEAIHDTGDGTTIHNVIPVPWETDALSVIGSTVLFGFGLWAKSKSAKSNKNIDLD
jgi:hypothetical protein